MAGSDEVGEIRTARGTVHIIARATPPQMRSWRMDAGLGLFWNRHPERQHRALMEIAAMPQGRVIVALTPPDVIVGFLTFHPPSPLSRWGQANLAGLVELGGIEVSPPWRRQGLARGMLAAAFANQEYDDKIVIATGLNWCWDLQGTGLSLREYQKMLMGLFRAFGFVPYSTDDPEIARYPGNGLVARIGPRVSPMLREAFTALCFAERLPLADQVAVR